MSKHQQQDNSRSLLVCSVVRFYWHTNTHTDTQLKYKHINFLSHNRKKSGHTNIKLIYLVLIEFYLKFHYRRIIIRKINYIDSIWKKMCIWFDLLHIIICHFVFIKICCLYEINCHCWFTQKFIGKKNETKKYRRGEVVGLF